MSDKLYNMIMGYDPEFWLGSDKYVDFPKDRFLERTTDDTTDDIKNQFQSLDPNAINQLKELPTLFAVEHERTDTRIGTVVNIEVKPTLLRVRYQFSKDHYPLTKGVLQKNRQKLNIHNREFHRTHWAIKECDISVFYEEYLKTLTGVAHKLKASDKKVQLIYAFNGMGKTRLSREFKELIAPNNNGDEGVDQTELSCKNILYYNVFTEDLFYWDNDLNGDEDRKLKIHPNAFTKWVLEDQGQGPTIIGHFQRLTNSNIEPKFSADFSEISFAIRGDGQGSPIKISKGEESNLIWSMFYSLLELIIEELSSPEDDRGTGDFNGLKYVFIDDPVSSLDDNHLIELAVDLARLVKSSSADLKFIVTTHNPLFYNVLSNEFKNKLAKDPNAEKIEWVYQSKESVNFYLDKNNVDGTFAITKLDRKTPLSYHLLLLSEIRDAIQDNQVKKYHFNFMRNILEKTTTFLGHDKWENLLPKAADGNPDPFANRILNLSSHSAHAGEETGEIEANDKKKLEDLVNSLSTKYGFWRQEESNE